MAGEVIITVVGNLTRDPELRQAGNDQVASFAVASNERKFNRQSNEWEDGTPLFLECAAWRELGQNVSQSLRKGMNVVVVGKLKQRSYEKDGQTRTVVELEVQNIGPNLGNQIAQVQKVQKQAPQQQGYPPQQGAPQGYPPQPWAGTQQAPYAGPAQVPGYPTPQGYPAPGGGYQQAVGPGGQPMPQQQPAQPPAQAGFPDARTYQPPAPGYQHPTDPNTPF